MNNQDYRTIYQSNHIVRHHACGPDGKIKLQAVLDLFQDAAAEHADVLGFGMNDLSSLQYIWVLYQLKIAIIRPPELGEKLTVKTYPSGVQKLFAVRQYGIFDEKGEALVIASSFWLVINKANSRPIPPVKVLDPEKMENPELPRYFDFSGKKREMEALPGLGECHRVSHSDIDLNQHLNNAIYSRISADWLGKMTGKFILPREFRIDFTHAARLGDEIFGFGAIDSDGIFHLEGRSGDGETVFFYASGRI